MSPASKVEVRLTADQRAALHPLVAQRLEDSSQERRRLAVGARPDAQDQGGVDIADVPLRALRVARCRDGERVPSPMGSLATGHRC
jgi:hypothetical protein